MFILQVILIHNLRNSLKVYEKDASRYPWFKNISDSTPYISLLDWEGIMLGSKDSILKTL